MNGVELNFNAANVAPQLGMDPAPAGWYIMAITESELKPTKQGDGAYLNLTFSILEGAHKNKKAFMRLNIRNASPAAQEIGYKQLSAVAHAAGVLNVQTSAQLHNIPMKGKLKVRKDPNGQYDDNNEIVSLKNMREPVPEMDAQNGASGAAPASAGFTMPPVQQPAQQPAFQMPQQAAPQPQYQQPAPQQAFNPAQFAPQPWEQNPAANGGGGGYAAPAQNYSHPPAQQPAQQVQPQPAQQPAQQPQQNNLAWAQANPVQPVQQPAQQPQHTAAPAGYAPSTDVPPWARPIQ